MMLRLILFCAGFYMIFSFSACKCNKSEEPPVADTLTTDDTISLRPENEAYASWDEFYSKNDVSFSIDSFFRSDTARVDLFKRQMTLDDTFYRKYGNLLVYNDDSSLFIDPFSYHLIVDIEKNGKLTGREGEIDNEVAIVDPKTGQRTRVLFCGPACQVQKAFWYNDHIIGIMGVISEYSDEYYTPTIWFVNIHTGVTIPYHYHSGVNISRASEYMKRHIESKGIEMRY